MFLRSPRLAVTLDEARALAKASKEVLSHYKINPNPKVMAWIQFAGVAGVIYGKRLIDALADRAKQKAAQAKPVVTPGPKEPMTQGGEGMPPSEFPTGPIKFN